MILIIKIMQNTHIKLPKTPVLSAVSVLPFHFSFSFTFALHALVVTITSLSTIAGYLFFSICRLGFSEILRHISSSDLTI